MAHESRSATARTTGLLLILLAAGVTATAWAVGPYDIIEMGVGGDVGYGVPDWSTAYGINDNGDLCGVVGYESAPGWGSGLSHAAVWEWGAADVVNLHDGSYAGLELGTKGHAFAINDAGHIAGRRTTSSVQEGLYIDYPAGTTAQFAGESMNDINSADDVAIQTAANRGWIWNPLPESIDMGTVLSVIGISERTGGNLSDVYLAGGGLTGSNLHPFIWDSSYTGGIGQGGHVRLLGVPSGWTNGWAFDVTAAQQVVGFVHSGGTYGPSVNRQAFYWEPATGYSVLPDHDGESWARRINSAGQIVGYTNPGASSRAALWEYDNGWEVHDLNDYIPADSAWTLAVAQDINDVGQICGWGYNASGDKRGFILTSPTPGDDSPEPATWVLIACTVAVGALRRRRG